MTRIEQINLGTLSYDEALVVQREQHRRVLSSRDSSLPLEAVILRVEHDPPVITKSKRASAASNIIATDEQIVAAGVQVRDTDRGGDVTYHGPGQQVLYPIVDLNAFGLRLHPYVRLLEQIVIESCNDHGVCTTRDSRATGVWTSDSNGELQPTSAKIAAIGIRVSRWVSMHGLALNVAPDLEHFKLIIPCGLTGRAVTSMREQLSKERTPSMSVIGEQLARKLEHELITLRRTRVSRSG